MRSCGIDARADARRRTLIHLGDALVALRVGSVDDVQQEVRFARLHQRGPEGGDELVRQVAHEADRIRDDHVGPCWSFSRRTVGSSVANSWSAT